MFDIVERYEDRIEAAKERLARTWRGQNVDRPAFVLSDVNYWITGVADEPDDYYEPAAMFAYQAAKIERHMAEIADDYIPVFHPWYGTAVLPSALGVGVRFQKGMDPAAEAPVIETPADARKLELPDPEKDGLLPSVLAAIDYFRANTDAPVCATDTQGPLNIALTLVGTDRLFLWMYDDPPAVHQVMDFCTEALIRWVEVQKQHAGQPRDGGAYPHAIFLPPGFGGVAFSDDDLSQISADHYREFVVPYNARLLEAFDGGTLHFCGSARHQLTNLAALDACTGVNNFMMGDLEQAQLLRGPFAGRGAIMACDFNEADIPAHCESLKHLAEDPAGLVVGVFITPAMALSNGRYDASTRTRDEIVDQYLDGLACWLNRR